MSRRVVVTGMGVVTPIGSTLESFWEHLLCGVSGAGPVTQFDCSALERRVACEVKGFNLKDFVHGASGNGRATQLALAASTMALADSGLDVGSLDLRNAGICIGTTMGEHEPIDLIMRRNGRSSIAHDTDERRPVWVAHCNVIAEAIADTTGFGGSVMTVPTACSAGNYAIGRAADLIREGRARVMITGGADSLSRSAFLGFARILSMSPDVCRPFDRNRRGLLVGEGSGMLILEEFESAVMRGAQIYAEVLGYAVSCDAYHMTTPHPEGKGAVAAMTRALASAGLAPEAVDYISAHGTGTQINDRVETAAIKKVFRERASEVPVSSIKALIGHTMGAASAIEAVTCCLAIREQVIPPTWNYQDADPECDLDCVPNGPRKTKLRVALSNSFAFGGNNACLIFGTTGTESQ